MLTQQRCSSSNITFYTSFTMSGLLSLPNVLIELVVEHVIGAEQLGLKDWCRAASTCKRLRGMQLPDIATAWCVNLDSDIKGESEMRSHSLPCMCQ